MDVDKVEAVVDPGSQFARWTLLQRASKPVNSQPFVASRSAQIKLVPPPALTDNPSTSLPIKLAHTCHNRSKRAVFCVCWTPDGRRVLSGTMNGEFALFNGNSFGMEMVMQAHENAVRCLKYSHAGDWLISGDQDGQLKVWQPNFNNVKMERAHAEVMRGVCWSPNDTKLATCSDDSSVKIWSFATMTEEHSFVGPQAHGWDVKCVDWHPSMALLASGSKDNTLRLWDPRQRELIQTIHSFKNTVSDVQFQPTGNQHLLAAASRDHTVQVFDLRKIANNDSSQILRGHSSDVACLQWHPIHSNLLSTGTHDGSLHHFLLDSGSSSNELGHLMPAWSIPKAHAWPLWDMAYHPVGHCLATGSNDKSVRIWTRAALGDSADALKVPDMNETSEPPADIKPTVVSDSKTVKIPGLP